MEGKVRGRSQELLGSWGFLLEIEHEDEERPADGDVGRGASMVGPRNLVIGPVASGFRWPGPERPPGGRGWWVDGTGARNRDRRREIAATGSRISEAQTAHLALKRSASSQAFQRSLRARKAWPRRGALPLRSSCPLSFSPDQGFSGGRCPSRRQK